ncbi:hypothetical protein EAI_04288 [Harpegnathos saltator]|uniref:Uncharacterized protein n=2 Tax=Harpegnathos saltator TaxID=610380 RepID=E2BZ57_HARSA|nr:hypothetical protein EAI_04288 [Harpegnathos saltator]
MEMGEFTSNGAPVEDTENRESVMINSDIKEYMKLKKSVEDSNQVVKYWTDETSKLLESNGNIETNHDKLMMKISEIDKQISEITNIHATKEQELENLQNARTNLSHKLWNDCLSEVGKYADNFCQWIKEYSNNVLMKDIENFHKECEEVETDLVNLKQELNDMQRKHNSDYVEANTGIKDLSNLNTVITDIRRSNNNLMHTIRLTEVSLNKIEKKIEQNKIAINECKAKENTNMF